jgi:hypothetical protein
MISYEKHAKIAAEAADRMFDKGSYREGYALKELAQVYQEQQDKSKKQK